MPMGSTTEAEFPDDLPMVEMIDDVSANTKTQAPYPAPPPLPPVTRIHRPMLVPPLATHSPVETINNSYALPFVPSNSNNLDDAQAMHAAVTPTRYEDVPWLRRSGTVTAFMLIGLIIPPLLWTACGICLTGEIYNNQAKEDGMLSRWSSANKVVAIIILLIHTIGIVSSFR
jgi:hypothetical protein